jgi:hypothetical protein
MNYPKMAYITQRLHEQTVGDIASAVEVVLGGIGLEGLHAGSSVAVAVGSRGICQLSTIVRETIRCLKRGQLKPFIVPAMGSHGGNTPAGQVAALALLGITESAMGVPVQASPDVVEIGRMKAGLPILWDSNAAGADHVVVINRIKPHTKFHGPLGSGVTKMLTIGLGKGHGAALYHRAAIRDSFAVLQEAAKIILKNRPVLFGLAVLEDGYQHVAKIVAIPPNDWFQRESLELEEARAMMPAIPFDPIDILVIDEIGKEISGIGMDSHVTGRHRDIVGDFFTAPHAKRIFVRDLSAASDGNGNGIGLADVTTKRLVDALDLDKTYANAIVAISPEKAALPMHFPTDRQCLDACLQTIGMVEPENVRLVRIKNTLAMDRLWISRALENQIDPEGNVCVVSPWESMAFNEDGNLPEMKR